TKVLAELDHDDLKASLRQQKAELAVLERRLEALQKTAPLQKRLAEGLCAERTAQLDLAQSNLKRVEQLIAGRVLPETVQQRDVAIQELATAKARLEQAKASLDHVEIKVSTDIATLKAQVHQVQATMHSTEVQIRWCTLSASIDGQVFAVHQRPGELANNAP